MVGFSLSETHFLIAAIVIISSALVFYSIGVWSERLQHGLREWHLLFFFLGLCADTAGTTLMGHIAHVFHLHNELHTITGLIALLLMLIHFGWALWTYFEGSEKAKRHFNRFSIFVWAIWLIPYFTGMYIGMSMHH